MAILNGICSCDRCNKALQKGEGALNIRNSRLYCRECWQKMKSYDDRGEEIPLSDTWERAVERTGREGIQTG